MKVRKYYTLVPLCLLLTLGLSAQYTGGAGGGSGKQRAAESTLEGEATAPMFSGGAGDGASRETSEATVAGLPLSLLRFDAGVKGRLAVLYWKTEEEYNTDYFGIERSADGRYFTPIGRSDAAGESRPGQQHDYFYEDLSPLPGTSYYRLRMVDFDGTYTYSAIRAITFDVLDWSLTIHPNPTRKGRFSILLNGVQSDQRATLTIHSVTGREVHREELSGAGGPRYQVLPRNLLTGSYFVKVQRQGSTHLIHKLIVID